MLQSAQRLIGGNANYKIKIMNKNLVIKVLIIAVPTYTMAIITNAMVYTIPMLAISTLIATNIFKDDEDIPLDQCYVTEFYFNNVWREAKKPVNLVMALNILGKKWKNEKCRF